MCFVWFADLRRSLRSLARLPKHMHHWQFIYSAVGNRRLQQRVILQYNTDASNKADRL